MTPFSTVRMMLLDSGLLWTLELLTDYLLMLGFHRLLFNLFISGDCLCHLMKFLHQFTPLWTSDLAWVSFWLLVHWGFLAWLPGPFFLNRLIFFVFIKEIISLSLCLSSFRMPFPVMLWLWINWLSNWIHSIWALWRHLLGEINHTFMRAMMTFRSHNLRSFLGRYQYNLGILRYTLVWFWGLFTLLLQLSALISWNL